MKDNTSSDGVYARSALSDSISEREAELFPELDRESPTFIQALNELVRMRMAGIKIGSREIEIAQALAASEMPADRPAFPGLGVALTSDSNPSTVYFIQLGDLVKIGVTKNSVDRRMSGMQMAPGAKIICTIEVADRGYETAIHAMFDADRVQGEWFTLSQQIRDFIAKQAA